MAASKCVVVLAPNGRRQNVKVTPNMTILQVWIYQFDFSLYSQIYYLRNLDLSCLP